MTERKFEQLYQSMISVVEGLEAELAELKRINAILEAEKMQWVAEKMAQQAIIQQALSDANATSNQYLEENRELKEEIKRLKEL